MLIMNLAGLSIQSIKIDTFNKQELIVIED